MARLPGGSLALIFGLAIFLPGAILATLGVRALFQEQQLADQETRSRLEHIATLAADDVGREIQAWQLAIDRVTRTDPVDPSVLPNAIRQAVAAPGTAVIVTDSAGRRRGWPESALAYRPGDQLPAPELRPRAYDDAAAIEMIAQDPGRAIAAYERLLPSARGGDRAWLLHRLAVAFRKSGQPSRALAVLDELERFGGTRVADVSAEFLARYERCEGYAHRQRIDMLAPAALALHRDLVNGKWIFEKFRFLAYVAQTQAWAALNRAHAAALAVEDDVLGRKIALTDAIANANGDAAVTNRFLVLRSSDDRAGQPVAALWISKSWLADHVWPRVLAASVRPPGVGVVFATAAGEVFFQTASSPAWTSMSVQTIAPGREMWKVGVWAADPTLFSGDLRRQQRWSIVMVAGVVSLLAFGTYLTARVIRREREIARMKSDFVSAVSHEFRSPLTGIRQLAEMLSRGRVPNESRRQEYYERITRETDRLSRVVENLLEVARTDGDDKVYRFEPLDTAAWLRAMVEDFAGQSTTNGHRLIASIPETLPTVVGDRQALTTAVVNLLDNAVKYSPDADAVWLDAEPEGAGITIRVRDRGVGIADGDKAHIFERFYRGQNGATVPVRGTGLGLNLVQQIVQAHGGRIKVDSRAGEGSTFAVHLHVDGGRASRPAR